MNKIETLLSELGRASMCAEVSSYNGITKKQSSISYRMKIEQLYSNAVSELYGLNDTQREIVIKRIGEVRENQENFDIPTNETVNSLLRDYNNQAEGKRNKALLDDYRYCKFVLECVAMQKEYLVKFASLFSIDKTQKDTIDSDPGNSIEKIKDDTWLSAKKTAAKFGLSYNRIKDRKWRIKNNFPFEGFDETKGAKNKVSFNTRDVEDWIKNHKRKK